MEDVVEFCERVMGASAEAGDAAREALSSTTGDHVEMLIAASRACRSRNPPTGPQVADADAPRTLAEAVATELALATAMLPERQREVLALRELALLSYEQIAAVMGIGRPAVAPLLARARLGLREARRGAPAHRPAECDERDRALRTLALRHDGEPLDEDDCDWVANHLGECDSCAQAQAMMLEASLCYRAWEPRAARITHAEQVQAPVELEVSTTPDREPPPISRGSIALRGAKPSWWQRLGAAVAADARR